MEKGRAHVHEDGRQTDGSALTSPVRRRVNYRPSNRIDVKDLRRVVLPPYSVSAVSRFLSARERESTSRSQLRLETHDRCARSERKLFEKSSRCISVRPILDDTVGSPPILFLHALFVSLSARFKPDRRNDLWRRKADTTDSVLLLLLLDTDSNYSPSGKTSPTVIPKRDISSLCHFLEKKLEKL